MVIGSDQYENLINWKNYNEVINSVNIVCFNRKLNAISGLFNTDIIDFDYPNKQINFWHTMQDTPENCSPQSLQQVGTLLLNYVYGKVTK